MRLRSIVLGVVAIAASLAPVQAAVVYSPALGTATASVFTDFSTFSLFDVRGLSASVLTTGETAFVLDEQNGNDPNFQTLPFGNLVLNVLGFAGNVSTLTFDETSTQISGNFLQMQASGNLLVDINGGLDPLVGGPFLASFLQRQGDPEAFGGGFIVRYDLLSIDTIDPVTAVPEPSTAALMGLILPAAFYIARRKR